MDRNSDVCLLIEQPNRHKAKAVSRNEQKAAGAGCMENVTSPESH